MPKCYYKDCNSTSKSKKYKQLRYYPFPKPARNLLQCLLWLEFCGNEKLNVTNVTKNTYVCENHFGGERKPETNPIPFYEHTGEDPRKFRSLEVGSAMEIGSDNEDEYTKILSSLENQQEDDRNFDHTYSCIPNATTAQEHKATQTISRNLFINSEVNVGPDQNVFSFRFRSLSKSVHFQYFTGLTLPQFEALFTFLDPSVMPMLKYTRRNKTPIKTNKLKRFTDKEKLCLTLIRLKKGYTLKELSIFYNASICHMSVIFHTWVQFTYLQCCGLRNDFIKGSRNMERNEMPACFRAFEPKITAILDGTEIMMQMSRNFQRQGNTFSSYKHYNSIKFLVGVSTRGTIIYNSEGYEGSISDVELFKSCDIQNFLEEGDVLMVDRGFTIQDICDEKKYKLLIPPFLVGRSKLTAEEEILTKKIAKGRIHVERAIQRIKTFQILAKPIPISMLPLISNIFSIICFLVNFEKPLVT